MLRATPVVTGVGILGAAGCGPGEVWEALRAGRDGLGPLTLFDSPRYGRVPVGQVRLDVDRLAGSVRGSRSDKLAWIAARQALHQAGLLDPARLSAIPPARRGVMLGATVGGMAGSERFLDGLLHGRRSGGGALRYHECSVSADLCAARIGCEGPVLTFSTACSSGSVAIAAAAGAIAGGEADLVLAGGTDSLCRLTLNGFGSLLLLDPQGCRPFDARRAGISIGEGAAVLVLESRASAEARGATILAELAGWGASCDAWHATAPHPEGDGAVAAMQQALARAGLAPAAIGYICAHGTGTRDNDRVEGRALRRVFGDRVPPFSSVKRAFGHTLGASGAVNAAVCVLALARREVPPNAGPGEADPEIGIDPVRAASGADLDHAMANAFGFGGNNAVLVFSRPSARGTVEVRGPETRWAIVGTGVVSPAGSTQDAALASLSAGVDPTVLELGPPLPPGRAEVRACGDFGAAERIPAGRRRKLGRLQQMTLVAAGQCLAADLRERFAPDRVCVAIGTGLGSLNEATAFVENMLANGEREPLPLAFTNSVHNAPAAQAAIEWKLRGLNSTPTAHGISFEAALWHAMEELRSGGADLALVGAADELNRHAVATGLRWGRVRRWPVPGEGAAAFAVTRPAPGIRPMAHLLGLRLGRVQGGFDPAREARWIRDTLVANGRAPAELDLLLAGAGDGALPEAACSALAAELGVPCETYVRSSGAHAAASAFGFLVAVGRVGRPAATGPAPRLVALHTLTPDGSKALCLVGT